ncbi:MAG: glycosyltransferase family 39 protein [Nitrososphaerota archaeon]
MVALRRISIWCSIVSITLIEVVSHFGTFSIDSPQYIELSLFFKGELNKLSDWGQYRLLLRPLIPYLASLLYPAIDFRIIYTMLNTVFLIIAGLAIYALTKQLFDERTGFYAALLMLTSFPLIVWGPSILTDAAGLAFTLLGYLLVLQTFTKRGINKYTYLGGWLVGIGILARETVLSVCLFALLYALWRRNFKQLLVFLISALIIPLSWWLLNFFKITLPNWTEWLTLNPFTTISLAFFAHRVPGILAIIGFLSVEEKHVFKTWILILIATTIPWFVFIGNIRLTILLYPATMIMAAIGLKAVSENISKKPILGKINTNIWAAMLLILTMIDGNYQAWELLGCKFLFPWEEPISIP